MAFCCDMYDITGATLYGFSPELSCTGLKTYLAIHMISCSKRCSSRNNQIEGSISSYDVCVVLCEQCVRLALVLSDVFVRILG